jgi:signal transduction histidine kinase
MNNEIPNNAPNRISNKVRFSIVWKLNIKLFFRTLGIFLSLNIFLLLLAAAGLLIHADQTAEEAVKTIQQAGLPDEDAESWLTLNGYSISIQADQEEGFQIPQGFRTYFPELTAAGVRSLTVSESPDLTLRERLQSLSYNVSIETNEENEENQGFYYISVHPQRTLEIALMLFAIIIILELLMLFSSIFSGAKMIRRTLQPIQELAEAAQNLSTEGVFSPEQLKDLAGKLDNINATKLDTRISVGETQSELKSLAAAINSMLDRINESYRSQVRFVSDASHELRTPISVLQGYANLLDRWGKNDEKTLQECIDAIKEETANMKDLVEQLLFLARGDNNTMALQMEHFELSELANEVLRETQMIDSGHEYSSSGTPVYINADKSLIKQASRILVDNAMKYTPAGKKITISVSQTNGKARMSVQDEGIGIAPEAVSKIFDRFYRADESRARATGGAGLGLSIAKWITERHGGYLEVLSRVDIGTRISILLPIAPEGASGTAPDAKENPASPCPGLHTF